MLRPRCDEHRARQCGALLTALVFRQCDSLERFCWLPSVGDRLAIGVPADRLIAALALHLQVPLITKDRRLRSLNRLTTIW